MSREGSAHRRARPSHRPAIGVEPHDGRRSQDARPARADAGGASRSNRAEGAPPNAQGSLTVYYDGACPLCRREIGFYRRLRGADRIDWVDVRAVAEESVGPGLCRGDALARFHVRRADGRLATGGQAFAELWQALPGLRWLGALARLPGAARALDAGYAVFLRLRPAAQRLARRF